MDRTAFEERLAFLAAGIRERDDFALVYHHDVDGITSGAIMGRVLQHLGKRFTPRCIKQLYSDTVEEIRGMGKTYLFCDFGAGQLDFLTRAFGKDIFILDHHQPNLPTQPLQLNPFDFGINGSSEICSAGLAYFLAKTVDPSLTSLAALAVVGAAGDMQDTSGRLEGLNREILQDGVDAGVLGVHTDLRLYGRISRPLTQYLAFSTSPVIPELTASEENVTRFLMQLGIELKEGEQWKSYEQLSAPEKKKLSSALIVHMHNHHVPEWKIRSMIGEVYTLLQEPSNSLLRDAKEFGTLCNSCGRHGEGEIAFRVAMGDRDEYLQAASSLLQEHRRQLRAGIEFVQAGGIEEKEQFCYFDAGTEIKETLVGIVAGMLYGSGTIGDAKPIIAMARTRENDIKVSARATQELVRNGINLGMALRTVCRSIGHGAEGGGHTIAAGCKIPADAKVSFLDQLDVQLRQQLQPAVRHV